MNKMKEISVIFITSLMLLFFTGCDNQTNRQAAVHEPGAPPPGGVSFENISFRDIPGISGEEIRAIEDLQQQEISFIYGMPLSTEAFFGENGDIKGFTALFCEWLTGIFEIPFIPRHYEWLDLLDALHSGEVDFSGEVTATEARRPLFFMSDDIAKRPLKYFRIENSVPLPEIAADRRATNGRLRYGFISGTMTHNTVAAVSDTDSYEVVFISNLSMVHSALSNGDIDAFFYSGPVEASFDHYGDIVAEYFLPYVYIPVSLVTSRQRPELEPIISAVDKILQNEGMRYLTGLYNQGYSEYLRYKLRMRLTEEELIYIQNGSIVRFAAEYDNYPVSFYNFREREWQGIAFDVIAEIESLTGLTFERVTSQTTEWHDVFEILKDGRASMVTELIRTPDREDMFLWPNNIIFSNQFALISKTDRRNIRINEVMFTHVGLIQDSAYTAMFERWFPNHVYTVFFNSATDAFNALENDEVEMVMSSLFHLLILTNYRELPGYKANVLFNTGFDSTFGFNINEPALCSIVDKALSIIDTDGISGQWMRRTYDYRLALTQAQRPWILGAIVTLAIMLVFLTIIHFRDRKKRKIITGQAAVLSAIYDSIPGLVYTKDTGGLYTSSNRLFNNLACVGSAEIIGKHPKEITSLGGLIQTFEDDDKKVMSENRTIRTEGWFDLPNNSRIASEIIRAPLILDGKVAGLLGIALDITERKMAEKTIHDAHERMEVMLDTIPLCSCLITRKYECIDCNNEAARLFELNSKQEFIDYFMKLSPEYQPDGRPSIKTAMAIIDRAFEGEKFVGEWTHQLLDGTPLPAITTFERVQYGDDYIVFSYAQDRREHKRITDRIETIINNLPGMVFQQIFNPPVYTYTFVSEGCRDLLGYTPEELMGSSFKFFDMVHPDDIEGIEKHSAETLPFGLPFEAIFRITTRDGRKKWIWERSRVIEKNRDGTPRLVEGYYADISEQRQLEAAETANRAKTEFLAKMSHEIRTPMNSIMGFAELAMDIAVIPQVKDYLGKISDSTKWLLHIINDILDISKIEAGKMELERVPFDLRDVFSRCQSVILPDIKEKDLDLSIYAEPLTGKKLLGDPVRLYQILMNLLSNAVKFTNIGKVKFSSSIKNAENGSATIYFEIRDTGIGMSPEQLNIVFDPFMQADSSTTRDYGGTGLGLAITRNIVELMNGKLAVESSPGAGSKFSFEITFDTINALDDTPPQAKFDMLEKPYFNGLVLICDDNSMNREVICAHLARVGLKTITAENGRLGVEMVQERIQKNEKPFDLIFMDMFMPVMDGMEAAAKIKALNTGSPIVAMTANVMVSELEKYKKAGMPDCLGKPFTSQELWHILLHYLAPVGSNIIDEEEDNDELQKKLQLNFFRNNQNIHNQITEAVAAGDTKLAHRLAHSLKGNAGMIGKTALRNAAADVENLLKDGIASVWENKMNILKAELLSVLTELEQIFDESPVHREFKDLNAGEVLALFEKLQPMLENINPECIAMLDDIRVIPGSQDLVRQIENYDFEAAARTLSDLKKKLEG
ncbi:MAG: ATP-binding protein [Treponema sp.]|nr:ATP-binding protein [Treponema sp.]